MHLYVKNSCGIAFILSTPKKYSMAIKTNDSFFSIFRAHSELWIHMKIQRLLTINSTAKQSKAKQNNKKTLQQYSTHSIYLLVYFFTQCFCLPLIFSPLASRLSLAHHFVLFEIMRNDTVHKKSTKIIS